MIFNQKYLRFRFLILIFMGVCVVFRMPRFVHPAQIVGALIERQAVRPGWIRPASPPLQAVFRVWFRLSAQIGSEVNIQLFGFFLVHHIECIRKAAYKPLCGS
jgi:hypothetical protein